MTLKEAMTYRGENEETLAKALDTRPLPGSGDEFLCHR